MAYEENSIRFHFSSSAYPESTFQVVEFTGHEAISELYSFDIVLMSKEQNLDLNLLVKNGARFTIKSSDAAKDFNYHGALSVFEQLDKFKDLYFYRAVLVPKLWQSSLNKINEVYVSDKTIPQLVDEVFKRNSLDNNHYSIQLKDNSVYRQRSFVCQYQESDFNFISRSMEAAGMYYYFDQGDTRAANEKIKITDFKESHSSETLQLSFYGRDNSVQGTNQDKWVSELKTKRISLPESVVVQDYNYRKAELVDLLKKTTSVSDNGHGQVMYYGQNLRDESEVSHLAQIRAETIIASSMIYSFKGFAVGVRSGYFIQLEKHYRADCNKRYLVTKVSHSGSQAGVVLGGESSPYTLQNPSTNYTCEFTAIDASTQYRQDQVTPIPKISGVLSAIIDGEGSGGVPELNEYGQYKVQLTYDLSDKNSNKGSSWIRMASPHAGSKNGAHFPLYSGTEVLLTFLGGDPDQPVIIGAVFNSENPNIVDSKNATSNLIKSYKGNSINVNDSESQTGVQIYSPTSNSFFIIGS